MVRKGGGWGSRGGHCAYAPAQETSVRELTCSLPSWCACRGHYNVGYHHDTPSKEVVTPNIDALVADGVQLDRHYVHQVSCARSSTPRRHGAACGTLVVRRTPRRHGAACGMLVVHRTRVVRGAHASPPLSPRQSTVLLAHEIERAIRALAHPRECGQR